MQEAKIVAMTCTHAALKRKELAQMGFKFDNILMEVKPKIRCISTFTAHHCALDKFSNEQQILGFILKESAQILEIETFIPLLLQNPEDGYNRLKRWIMIGKLSQLSDN